MKVIGSTDTDGTNIGLHNGEMITFDTSLIKVKAIPRPVVYSSYRRILWDYPPFTKGQIVLVRQVDCKNRNRPMVYFVWCMADRLKAPC